MSGLIRPHALVPGDPLDLRRVEESFLWAGQSMNDLLSKALGNIQLGRDKFTAQAFVQMWHLRDPDAFQKIPHNPGLVSGTDIAIRNDDSFVSGILTWSIEAKVPEQASSMMITGWPVFESKSLWQGQDWAIMDNELQYGATPSGPDDVIAGTNFPSGSPVSLGGTCTFSGQNGRMLSGVMVLSIGAWNIIKSQMTIRTRDR